MDVLTLFVNDIAAFKIEWPLWFKMFIVIALIVILLVAAYFIRASVDISYMKNGFMWFVVIAIINLLSILLIFYYYGKKSDANAYVGARGVKGKKGKRGKRGVSVSCSYLCKNNLYIQKVRKTDKICTLSTYKNDFDKINDAYKYFMKFVNERENIDYSSFLTNILIKAGKPLTDIEKKKISQDAVDKFQLLLGSINNIIWLLVKSMNDEITKASEYTYGTIRSSVPKVGYISLGNSVYGGNEPFELNSFVVSGDVMYPSSYDKLVSFKSYNDETEDFDEYTIWAMVSQVVNEPKFEGGTKPIEYLPLGDVCSFGKNNPKINDFAMIKETCLEPVDVKELKLIFIYIGKIEIVSNVDYTKSTSYLIENTNNEIELFSVWRTPMNTFITNSNARNKLTNNTVIYNILNELDMVLNEYGNINNEYKVWVNKTLSTIEIPQFLTALIYIQNYQYETERELLYYLNKYKTQVYEFRNKDFNKMTFNKIIELIEKTKKAYKTFNENLMKQASISLRGTKPLIYDEKAEKHLPATLLQIYDKIMGQFESLPVKIENSTSLLDIVNNVIPNGLNGRVAVDSTGLAEGGILLNPIQEMIVRMCKIIFPPNRPVYMIKDECLGTFSRDNTKDDRIKEFSEVKGMYNDYINTITTNYNKFESQIQIIKTYEDLALKKIGMLSGNIENYMEKVQNMDLEEFTTTKIEGLINIYKETNSYLEIIINNTLD